MTTNMLKLWQSIMAALMFTTTYAGLSDILPAKVAAVFVLVVGALATATGFYTAHVGDMPGDAGK